MDRAPLCALGALWLVSGCAAVGAPAALKPTGALVLFDDSTLPLQYRSDLAAGATREVTGESCLRGFVLPIFLTAFIPPHPTVYGNIVERIGAVSLDWGEAGWREALGQARARANGALSDVRADLHVTSILGIYREECLIVHAAAR
jgi:hypothetical protein